MDKSLLRFIQSVVAILLLLCLFHMPYGYFTFVRFATTIAFSIMAYIYFEEDKKLTIIFGMLAILFQPFIKIALGRDGWNLVDVVVAIFLICLIFKEGN